jgi:hypothetical protein
MWLIKKYNELMSFHSDVASSDNLEEAKAWCDDQGKEIGQTYSWELIDSPGLFITGFTNPGRMPTWRIIELLLIQEDKDWQKKKIKDMVI